jgi:hypothetical protein
LKVPRQQFLITEECLFDGSWNGAAAFMFGGRQVAHMLAKIFKKRLFVWLFIESKYFSAENIFNHFVTVV